MKWVDRIVILVCNLLIRAEDKSNIIRIYGRRWIETHVLIVLKNVGLNSQVWNNTRHQRYIRQQTKFTHYLEGTT